MATNLAVKRMTRERVMLEKPNDDYVVLFKDDNIMKFDAYIFGPSDTLYSHKFIKLSFEIPSQYPLAPPKVTFIQHSGNRIHPNLYKDGKVCLSILGTWEGEKWAFAMTCETVLITIRSLLDNKPYLHEPNQHDNPAYNDYVQYNTWRWLLLDYLHHETEPVFRSIMQARIAREGAAMLPELRRQSIKNTGLTRFSSPYSARHGVAGPDAVPNYRALEKALCLAVHDCEAAVQARENPMLDGVYALDSETVVKEEGAVAAEKMAADREAAERKDAADLDDVVSDGPAVAGSPGDGNENSSEDSWEVVG